MKPEPSHSIHPLVLQLQRLFNRDLVEKYEFLRVQLDIAVENQDKPIRCTNQQRSRLVKFGTPVRKHLDELCKLMKPDTLLTWHRDQKRKKWDYSKRVKTKAGRPPTDKDTVQIIPDITEENEHWGCRTIAGELQTLGHNLSPSAVYNILKANTQPGPVPSQSSCLDALRS